MDQIIFPTQRRQSAGRSKFLHADQLYYEYKRIELEGRGQRRRKTSTSYQGLLSKGNITHTALLLASWYLLRQILNFCFLVSYDEAENFL